MKMTRTHYVLIVMTDTGYLCAHTNSLKDAIDLAGDRTFRVSLRGDIIIQRGVHRLPTLEPMTGFWGEIRRAYINSKCLGAILGEESIGWRTLEKRFK